MWKHYAAKRLFWHLISHLPSNHQPQSPVIKKLTPFAHLESFVYGISFFFFSLSIYQTFSLVLFCILYILWSDARLFLWLYAYNFSHAHESHNISIIKGRSKHKKSDSLETFDCSYQALSGHCKKEAKNDHTKASAQQANGIITMASPKSWHKYSLRKTGVSAKRIRWLL